MILSLDLALETGWAVRHDDGPTETGVWYFKQHCDEAPGANRSLMPGHLLEVALDDLQGITHLVFEAAIARGGPSIWIQNTMQFAAMRWCYDNGVPFTRYRPTEWKKMMLGKGNASKDEYFMQARDRWPGLETDHEAAAMWMLECYQREIGRGGS